MKRLAVDRTMSKVEEPEFCGLSTGYKFGSQACSLARRYRLFPSTNGFHPNPFITRFALLISDLADAISEEERTFPESIYVAQT